MLFRSRHETRRRGVCLEVFDLSAGQGRTPEAVRIATTVVDTRMEMGRHCDGLRGRITEDDRAARFGLDNCGQIHKVSAFPACEDDLHSGTVCGVIRKGDH